MNPIPVRPAAHYLMGGIRTDLTGLYAAGGAACTGVRGAHFRSDYPNRDDANFQKHFELGHDNSVAFEEW